MKFSLRTRVRLAFLLLAGLLAPISYLTVSAFEYQPQKPLAPEAVALVRRYLGALQAGNQRRACRIFAVDSICAPGVDVRVKRFRVSKAEPTADGVEVPTTIDNQFALFELSGGPVRYRIDDIVSNPVPPALREFAGS